MNRTRNGTLPSSLPGLLQAVSAPRTQSRWFSLIILTLCWSIASAQTGTISPFQEYAYVVTTAQQVTPLSDNAFGDAVSMFNGTVEFSTTDISIPGNNKLPVSLGRRFTVETRNQGSDRELKTLGGFFDWDIEVPYIEGTFSQLYGWSMPQGGAVSASRCSLTGPPAVPNSGPPVDMVWHGFNVHIPGSADSRLLTAISGAFAAPTDGSAYPWVTKSNVRFRCLPNTANGYAGEGFVGVTPEGVSYYFNYAIERSALNLSYYDGAGTRSVTRKRVFLLATRIEDRFGNWVNYTYESGRLSSITANDGRSIALAWASDRVATATANGRTWIYGYQENIAGRDGGLSTVTQPDGSAWTFIKTGKLLTGDPPANTDACDGSFGTALGPFSYSVTHPAGATALFTFTQKMIWRGNDIGSCEPPMPNFYDVWGLDSKVISGPGLAPLTTTYAVAGGPAPLLSGVTDKWTTITHPDGTRSRYRHGTDFVLNEGKLLQEQTLSAAGVVLRDRIVSYVSDSEVGPFAAQIGINPHFFQSYETRIRPAKSVVVTQDSATFSTTVQSFDALARPINMTRASSLGFTRSDTLAYHDNTTRWVLGQTTSLTNGNTGLVESQKTFHPNSVLPTDVFSFGKKQQTLTYYADGTVQTVSDGAGHVTTLASWKRGIPQSIVYADGTAQSAVVSDDGWINSVTEQNGFTTAYGYDGMGRISSITYPTSDDVAWNGSSQVFSQVFGAEFGIATGHWRKTASVGNARKIVYYDALWRPLLTQEYDNADPAGTQRFTRFRYDHRNQVTFESYPGITDALTDGTSTQYDALGRKTTVVENSELGALTTRVEYLANLQVRTTNARNVQTLVSFQAFGEPEYERPTAIQHPEGAFTDIGRDLFGKPTSITRRNVDGSRAVIRRLVYDANQQLCKTIEPETGATVMDYDAAGNLDWSAAGLNLPSVSSCDRASAQASGRIVDRTYDTRNRIAALSFPGANGNQSWTYTPDGLPDTVTTLNDEGASQVVNRYEYNRRRMLKRETLTQPGLSAWTLAYGYNADGLQATITYPGGLVVDYAPNALGQPTRVGSYASAITYHPDGAIKQFSYGNGIVHTMTPNARQLPQRIVDSGGVLDHTFIYDETANVRNIADGVSSSASRAMTYDGLDRLRDATSSAFGGNGQITYTYDELDNLRSAKLAGVRQFNYTYDIATNRLTGILNDAGNSLFGLSYDLQGNVSSKNAQGFTFDLGNRLRSTELNGNVAERYRYDAFGRRVSAWSPAGGSIASQYGNDAVLRHQQDERSANATDYIYLSNRLIARVKSNVAPGVPHVTAPPLAPAGNFTVEWTARAATTSYELRESSNGGTAWATIYSGTALSRAVSGKTVGSYDYQARACSTLGCSAWSASARVMVPTAPTAAPTLSAPAISSNGVYTVSWAALGEASSYTLYESNGGAYTAVYSGAEQSQAFNKVPGTYSYRVQACNPAGCGPDSSVRAVQVIPPPGAPPTLNAPTQSETGSYTVSWASVAAATSYRLEESASAGAWSQIQDSSTTSKAITGKTPNVYSYRARACNAGGCSNYSGVVSIEVVAIPIGAPTLTAPASNTTGGYTVTWTTVAVATAYRLEESGDGGASWLELQNSASTTASIAGRSSGTYSYRARGCNAAGCGPNSNIVSTQVLRAPASAPSIATPASSTTGSYAVTWTTVATATSYRLEENVNAAGWTEIQNASTTSKSLSGKSSGSYTYRVRACNSTGCGDYSTAATTQVLLAPTSAPALSVPANNFTGSYTVGWSTVAFAATYRLEESTNGGAWSEFLNAALTSIAIPGKAMGTYSYRVRACNTTGCGEYSPTAAIQVIFTPTVAPVISQPVNSNTGAYTLSWTTVPTATLYRLEQQLAAWTELQASASTSMAFSGLSNGNRYYRVRACNAAGCSPYSATAIAIVDRIPAVPANLSVTYRRAPIVYNFTATWSAAEYANRYELNYGQASGTTSVQWTVFAEDIDVSEPFKVRACNAVGCSDWSPGVWAVVQ